MFWALISTSQAQEPTGPNLFTQETRPKAVRSAVDADQPVARTAIVTAVERVKAAVVNIHSERLSASDSFNLPAARKPMNGMGTGIIIDPRGYIVTNQHVIDDVTALRIRLGDGSSQSRRGDRPASGGRPRPHQDRPRQAVCKSCRSARRAISWSAKRSSPSATPLATNTPSASACQRPQTRCQPQ